MSDKTRRPLHFSSRSVGWVCVFSGHQFSHATDDIGATTLIQITEVRTGPPKPNNNSFAMSAAVFGAIALALAGGVVSLTPPGPPLPRQTPLQRSLTLETQRNATVASQAAHVELVARWSEPALLSQIQAVCPSLRTAATGEEVVARMHAELEVAELTHNFVWDTDGNVFDDVSLDSLHNASYLYNLWELDVLGFGHGHRTIEGLAEVVGLKYPPFANGSQAPNNYAEAADRPVYTVVNLLHLDMGDPVFGNIVAIANRSFSNDLALVAPSDTGNYFDHCHFNKTNPHCDFP